MEIIQAGIACSMLLALLVWSAWAVLRSNQSGVRQSIFFFLVAGAAVLVLRWPQIRWQHEIHVDESQMLAQAMRFYSHPVPWRDVDGMTGGPLDSLLLTAPMFAGIPASWQTARALLAVMNLLTLVFSYLSLRCFASRPEARLAVLPAIGFFAFAVHPDFTHYSSETLPSLLIAGGLFLICKSLRETKPSVARSFLLGLCVGAIPFAKIQAGPIALLLGGIGLIRIFARRKRRDPVGKALVRPCLALLSGSATLPAIILGVVGASGAFSEFWISYVLASVSYTGQEHFLAKEMNFERVLFAIPDFRTYFYSAAGTLMFLPAAWIARKRPVSRRLLWALIISSLETVTAMGCLLLAGKDYYHYALLLMPGLALLTGATFLCGHVILTDGSGFGGRISFHAVWVALFAGATAVLLVAGASRYSRGLVELAKIDLLLGADPISAVGKNIRVASRPGDTMSVWGWMPCYHVETQIAPASRLAVGDGTISRVPRRDYFRACYLEDLQKNMPVFFVDAIASDTFQWYWINPDSHERFPQLATFIEKNYDLWLSVRATNQTTIGSPVRVFVRKDRILAAHLTATNIFIRADPCYSFP